MPCSKKKRNGASDGARKVLHLRSDECNGSVARVRVERHVVVLKHAKDVLCGRKAEAVDHEASQHHHPSPETAVRSAVRDVNQSWTLA